MKINLSLELTPGEARELLGLGSGDPAGSTASPTVADVANGVVPLAAAGLAAWQQMVDGLKRDAGPR